MGDEMKKKTYGLTVFMLKPHIQDVTSAIKESNCHSCDIDLGNACAGKLFYKQNPSHLPKWARLFESSLESGLKNLSNSGTAAALVVQVREKYFVLTFGYGKSLLQADCYEENFGLRVVLNSVDPEKVRSVDTQSLDAVPLNKRSQASTATTLSSFDFNPDQDLVYAATGKPKNQILGKQLTGKDALKISVPLSLEDIPTLLGVLVSQYAAETYKENFAWVDNLSEVRSKSTIEKLDSALSDKINDGNFDRTWLSAPDVIEWSDVAGFRYQEEPKQSEPHDDIEWESYLASMSKDCPRTTDIFHKHNVYCISESSEQTVHTWTVYRCIYCELSLPDGQDYMLNNGKWFQVNNDFLKNLNESIKQIPVASLALPDYEHKDEAAYNVAVCHGNQKYFVLMDKNNISYGGGHRKIEFCDIFSKDKHLVHVKRYGGSSVLSHLFAQGAVSAELLLSDPEFRKKINERLPDSHKIENVDKKPEAKAFEVVYVIASNNSENAELPLFSKINLRNCFKRLQTYGMKASLQYVQVKRAAQSQGAKP
jgi:uncharacterized protein (TIGR04141 family)